MKSLKIAIINENWTAGATRCARDLKQHVSTSHVVRYYPRMPTETVHSVRSDIADFAPHIVHLHSYYSWLPYNFLSEVSHRYPTCFTLHDIRPIGIWHPLCYACACSRTCFRCPLVPRFRKMLFLNPYYWQRLRKRRTHHQAANTLVLITPSQWLRQRLLTTEFQRFTIYHIPNAVDLTIFRPLPDARTRVGIPHHRKILLYVSHPDATDWSVNHFKGLKHLADAFIGSVIPQYPDAMLLVAGEKLIPNHPNVRPLGYVMADMLPWFYSAADVFVSPTIADNLPYTILEAMACGVPVVASRVGGISEEVEDGVTGCLVPPGDDKALGAAILSVLANQEKWNNMSQASRLRAERLFRMELFVQRYETLYQQLAQGPLPCPPLLRGEKGGGEARNMTS